MKYLLLAFGFIFATDASASWPDQACTAATIASDAKLVLAPHMAGAAELYLTASDYRGITLTIDPATKNLTCVIPLAYYETNSWLSEAWDDITKDGWSPRPNEGIMNSHSDLSDLLRILDQAAIKVRRVSIVRIHRETKATRAIWNQVEFLVAPNQLPVLFDFLQKFYSDYAPDTKIHIYIRKKTEPNQPLQRTSTAVTNRAAHASRQLLRSLT